MVDRTEEFRLLEDRRPRLRALRELIRGKPEVALSPFAVVAAKLTSSIHAMEDFLERKGPEYLSQDFWGAGNGGGGGGGKAGLNSEDTRELEETLALFLTGATSEVQHLKTMAVQTAATARNGGEGGGEGFGSLASVERVMPPYRHKGTIAADDGQGEQGSVIQFQVNLVGTLNERLKALAHKMQHLQRTRQRYKVNPFRISSTLRLDSNRTKEQDEALQALASIPRRAKDNRSSALLKESSKSKSSSSNNKKQETKQEAPTPLAAKYAYDVGSAAEMARLNAIAEKHRKELEAENKDLQAKFSRESQQVRRLEGTVNEVSLMLVQFTELLEEQSESVIDVHRQSKITTQHVHESEDQLASALKSSASYRKMMVVLILAMSFAVLLLDILTP